MTVGSGRVRSEGRECSMFNTQCSRGKEHGRETGESVGLGAKQAVYN